MFKNYNKAHTTCPPYGRKEPLFSLLSDYFVNDIKKEKWSIKDKNEHVKVKVLLTLIKEKSLIHLDQSKSGYQELFIHL